MCPTQHKISLHSRYKALNAPAMKDLHQNSYICGRYMILHFIDIYKRVHTNIMRNPACGAKETKRGAWSKRGPEARQQHPCLWRRMLEFTSQGCRLLPICTTYTHASILSLGTARLILYP